MRCIHFDEWFLKYVSQWMEESETFQDMDQMEALMPSVYQRWLETPADWLAGVAPGAFFMAYTDATMLVTWMLDYLRENVPVPDPLLNRITMLGSDAESALFGVLTDQKASDEAQILAISLLTELESVLPMSFYVDFITCASETDERADHIAQALVAMGPSVVSPILNAVSGATRAGKEAFLDILCNFPGDHAIYALALSLFESDPGRRALYASLLGKLGDDSAIGSLRKALKDPALSYLDYIEIRNAIETLGGEVKENREFSGDPAYEALKRMV